MTQYKRECKKQLLGLFAGLATAETKTERSVLRRTIMKFAAKTIELCTRVDRCPEEGIEIVRASTRESLATCRNSKAKARVKYAAERIERDLQRVESALSNCRGVPAATEFAVLRANLPTPAERLVNRESLVDHVRSSEVRNRPTPILFQAVVRRPNEED